MLVIKQVVRESRSMTFYYNDVHVLVQVNTVYVLFCSCAVHVPPGNVKVGVVQWLERQA